MAMCVLVFLSAAVATVGFGVADDATTLIQAIVQASPANQTEDKVVDDKAVLVDDKAVDGTRHLILCNAYAGAHPLAISVRRTSQQLATLKYKECATSKGQVEDGDHFDFRDTTQPTDASLAQSSALGSFLVKALPNVDQALLLIINRQNGKVGFVSHAFDPEPQDGAQLAIIDTFNGPSNQKVPLHMKSASMNTTDLHFNGVATMSAGTYVFDINGTETELTAQNGSNYVILRTGTDDDDASGTTGFPQELVVYAESMSARLAASLMLVTTILTCQRWL